MSTNWSNYHWMVKISSDDHLLNQLSLDGKNIFRWPPIDPIIIQSSYFYHPMIIGSIGGHLKIFFGHLTSFLRYLTKKVCQNVRKFKKIDICILMNSYSITGSTGGFQYRYPVTWYWVGSLDAIYWCPVLVSVSHNYY